MNEEEPEYLNAFNNIDLELHFYLDFPPNVDLLLLKATQAKIKQEKWDNAIWRQI